MKHYISIKDLPNLMQTIEEGLALKKDPNTQKPGNGKTLGMIFLSPSLRTRLSTQKAASMLGMDSFNIDFANKGWGLSFEDGCVMNSVDGEHIKEAAPLMGRYCDILAIRAFPALKDLAEDYKEEVLTKFIELSGVPIVSLESSLHHPLQALADLMTIHEQKKTARPKVVLTWAPHCKALPQAVPNSFAEAALRYTCDLTIAHPPQHELDPKFTEGATITHDQNEALKGADFVYVKNWSPLEPYGQVTCMDPAWMMTLEKMKLTNDGKLMHCLPVRRNVVIADDVLDSEHSIVIDQAENRIYAAQIVLAQIIEGLNKG